MLNPDETLLEGRWQYEDGRVEADSTAWRVGQLIVDYLRRLDASDDGWSVLFQDPEDGRLWELTYPDSASHGGGPPRLEIVSVGAAGARYRLPNELADFQREQNGEQVGASDGGSAPN